MGKKRKTSRISSHPIKLKDIDPVDARLAIQSWKDVANSEDDFIGLDDEPTSKRLRRHDDSDVEDGDLELFRPEDSDESDSEEPLNGKRSGNGAGNEGESDDMDSITNDGDGENETYWGSSKNEYYATDKIETEEQARREEEEALRLQKKKLAKMSDADFAFDETDWAPASTSGDAADKDKAIFMETLKDVQVPADMSPEDGKRLLSTRFPEFDMLVDELQELQPQLKHAESEGQGKAVRSIEVLRWWVMASYVSALASYLAILCSPARDGHGAVKLVQPSVLRQHEIMTTLFECRELWSTVKQLGPAQEHESRPPLLSPVKDMDETLQPLVHFNKSARGDGGSLLSSRKTSERAEQAKAVEESLADLSIMLKKAKMSTRKTTEPAGQEKRTGEDNNSDFGEEHATTKPRKSLKFYTSQIVQKASRRADAGRTAGGDSDLPYRERFRDRQARLMREAAKRGRRGQDDDVLGHASSSDEKEVGDRGDRDDDEKYYDMLSQASKKKRATKEDFNNKLAAKGRNDRLVPEEKVGDDGKRALGWKIEKNKGLAPKRKKENRNPRVKKRLMYADKTKKLKSMKAVYAGPQTGAYQGEKSGIKTNLVKSVKLG